MALLLEGWERDARVRFEPGQAASCAPGVAAPLQRVASGLAALQRRCNGSTDIHVAHRIGRLQAPRQPLAMPPMHTKDDSHDNDPSFKPLLLLAAASAWPWPPQSPCAVFGGQPMPGFPSRQPTWPQPGVRDAAANVRAATPPVGRTAIHCPPTPRRRLADAHQQRWCTVCSRWSTARRPPQWPAHAGLQGRQRGRRLPGCSRIVDPARAYMFSPGSTCAAQGGMSGTSGVSGPSSFTTKTVSGSSCAYARTRALSPTS